MRTTSATQVNLPLLRKRGLTRDMWRACSTNVYVGRRETQGGNDWVGSKWQNPFPIKKCKDIKDCLKQYVNHLFESGLITQIHELRGSTLGCWCPSMRNAKGEPTCHAQLLADILNKCFHLIEHLQVYTT